MDSTSIKVNDRLAAGLLVLGVAAVYLSFPTRLYYWDGIDFARTIENVPRLGVSLLHPSHLIYNVAGFLVYRLLRLLSPDIRAVNALQVLDSLAGAAAAGVFYFILRKVTASSYLSFCLTLLFAFSATWWKFATDADAYTVSVLFLLAGFYFVLPGSKSRPYTVGLVFLIAVLFHQLAIFFGAVLITGLALQSRDQKTRIRNLTVFVVLTATSTAFIYFGCYYMASQNISVPGFFHWITYHSPDGEFSFSPLANLQYSARGFVRLFFGGRLNLIKGLVNPVTSSLFALLALAVLSFVYYSVRAVRAGLRPRFTNGPQRANRNILLMSLIWTGLYVVFLYFWIPQNTFYRLFYLPALILLIGLLLARMHHEGNGGFGLLSFVVALSLANFLFLIFPYSHVEKYPPLNFALELSREWSAETTVFYALDNSDESLVRYFNPRVHWQKLNSSATDSLDFTLKEIATRDGTTWLETTAIDNLGSTSEGARWLEEHTVKNSLREVNDRAYRIRFVQVAENLMMQSQHPTK